MNKNDEVKVKCLDEFLKQHKYLYVNEEAQIEILHEFFSTTTLVLSDKDSLKYLYNDIADTVPCFNFRCNETFSIEVPLYEMPKLLKKCRLS